LPERELENKETPTCSAGSGNLEAIHIIKKTGGTLCESYLDEGYILDKKIGVGQVRGASSSK